MRILHPLLILSTPFIAENKAAAGLGAGLLATGAAVTLAVVNTNSLSTASALFQFFALGIIGPQEVPHSPFAPQAGALWLAYASGRYFDATTSSRLQPAATLLVLCGRNVQPNSFALQLTLFPGRGSPNLVR